MEVLAGGLEVVFIVGLVESRVREERLVPWISLGANIAAAADSNKTGTITNSLRHILTEDIMRDCSTFLFAQKHSEVYKLTDEHAKR